MTKIRLSRDDYFFLISYAWIGIETLKEQKEAVERIDEITNERFKQEKREWINEENFKVYVHDDGLYIKKEYIISLILSYYSECNKDMRGILNDIIDELNYDSTPEIK